MTIGERTGTFVLRHVGSFADGAAKADVEVVDGTGTEDLTGVTGSGTFVADPAGAITLDLAFG